MLFNFVSVALLLAPLIMGEARFERVQGEKKAGSYIVKMKSGFSRSNVLAKVGGVRHKYEKNLYNGFAGNFDAAQLEAIRADPDVEAVYEDGIASISAIVTQSGSTYGLERISQRARASTPYTYTYDDRAGSGVDVYVLDTGVYVEHSDFGGRARWGASFSTDSPAMVDKHGHGTHCAGTVGGTIHGVAKKVSIIAVKVLADTGFGAWSDIIAGMNYVIQQKAASGRPSVISMSISGSAYQPIDDAVATVTNAGIHFVVAAGNNNADASGYSPARAPSAITVGSVDVNDTRAFLSSNYGSIVDVFAPGVSVLSDYIGSPTATATLSGTSMATPHAAGLVAYLISVLGDMTPAAMAQYLKDTSVKDALTDLPSGTPNNMIYNGVAGKNSGRREMMGRNMFE